LLLLCQQQLLYYGLWNVVGLDSSVSCYADCFAQAGITGKQLMLLANDDLEQIGINKLGHQEILLQSIALLQSLVTAVYTSTSSTAIGSFIFVQLVIFSGVILGIVLLSDC